LFLLFCWVGEYVFVGIHWVLLVLNVLVGIVGACGGGVANSMSGHDARAGIDMHLPQSGLGLAFGIVVLGISG